MLSAVYIINMLPTLVLDGETPHFRLTGTKPDYQHLRIFGCRSVVHVPARCWDNPTPRAHVCIFLGYGHSLGQKGYICYDPVTKKMNISRHVTFDEQRSYFSPSAAIQGEWGFATFCLHCFHFNFCYTD